MFREFGNFSKKKLQWGEGGLIFKDKFVSSDCAIVVPIYKAKPDNVEIASLKQLCNVVGDTYNIFLLHGKNFPIETYTKQTGRVFSEAICNDIYLKGRAEYSDMCETTEFYELFNNYKYMLIYQLDAWIFKDNIKYFVDLDYDYYGGIHSISGYSNIVGNGGFSLRKISKFISVCKANEGKKNIKERYPEDLAFTISLRNQFNIPSTKIGLEFGFQNSPNILFIKNGYKLPMGCHAFQICNYTWWKKYIKINETIKMEPKTISEKLSWLKVNDNNPLKAKCADKIKLHEYSIEKLGEDICVPILKIYDKPEDIKLSELPDKFVLKCNHGSGMNIVVKNKDKFNLSSSILRLKTWLSKDYSLSHGEKHYHNIPRKCYAEEFLDSGDKEIVDYKVWCFNGEPKFIQTVCDRNTGKYSNHYDLDWEYVEMHRSDLKSNPSKLCEKPKNLEKMVDYSRKLAQEFKFVRVDFYENNNSLYLGEMTFIPNAGTVKYQNSNYGIKIGNMLDIHKEPKHNKVIYTCIAGPYDTPMELSYRNNDFNYVCFTDNPKLKSNFWEIRQIPEKLAEYDNTRKNRYIKLHPHEFFPDYETSIYIDGNVNVKTNVNALLENECCIENGVFFAGEHPQRNCIYKEGEAVVKLKKDTSDNVSPQMTRYEKEGFPKNFGLTQNCILIRYHNDEDCIKLMEDWWDEVENNSRRDQLSLFYCIWKNGFTKYKILNKTIFDGKYFKWNRTHRRMPVAKPSTVNTVSMTEKKMPAQPMQETKKKSDEKRVLFLGDTAKVGTIRKAPVQFKRMQYKKATPHSAALRNFLGMI